MFQLKYSPRHRCQWNVSNPHSTFAQRSSRSQINVRMGIHFRESTCDSLLITHRNQHDSENHYVHKHNTKNSNTLWHHIWPANVTFLASCWPASPQSFRILHTITYAWPNDRWTHSLVPTWCRLHTHNSRALLRTRLWRWARQTVLVPLPDTVLTNVPNVNWALP